MFVFILSTLFLLTSAVTYKSVGSGFCANSNSQQLSYVAIVDVPDAETCERNCSSTSSCNGYLILVTLQCFLYGDPSALSSSDVCKTQTCSEITNDGGSAVATGVVGGPQVNCFVKETSSITYSEVGGGFCSNINQQPIPYVVIVDVSDDVACGQYCSCTEHCRGYLRLGSGPCWLYGDPFWLESDVPCLTAGVECHPIVEDNEGAPGDILNLAPTTCFAKDALQLYASYSTIGDGFCVDSSHEIIERVGFTATSDWNCLMNCTATSICEGYNYLDSVCYLFGPTELVDSEICERTACTHLTGSSNSISLAIGPPTTTCFSKSTHYIDYQESTGLCMDSNSQILPHVTATISSGFNPAQVPIATSSYCGSLCSSSALCTHYSIVAADISVNPDAVDTCILYGSTSELLSSVSCYDQDITCSSTQETDSSSGNCFTKLTYSSIGPGFCVDSNAGTIASMAFSTTSEQICQQYCSETINCIGFSYLASTDLCYLNGFLDSIEAEAVCTTRAGTTESCSRVPGTYKNISGAVGPPTTSCWQKDGSTIITPSPTLFPTALPTHVPTSAPTSPPTTSSPSQVPSFQPTTIPTVTPTKAPTDRPTSVPTQQPITSSNY